MSYAVLFVQMVRQYFRFFFKVSIETSAVRSAPYETSPFSDSHTIRGYYVTATIQALDNWPGQYVDGPLEIRFLMLGKMIHPGWSELQPNEWFETKALYLRITRDGEDSPRVSKRLEDPSDADFLDWLTRNLDAVPRAHEEGEDISVEDALARFEEDQ